MHLSLHTMFRWLGSHHQTTKKVHRASHMYEEKIETDSNVNKYSTTRLSTKIDTYEDETTVYKEIHDLAKEGPGGSMS